MNENDKKQESEPDPYVEALKELIAGFRVKYVPEKEKAHESIIGEAKDA